MVAAVCGEHGGERVVVAVDAREGVVAVEGWMESGRVTASELGRRMAGLGVARLLYTDIARDGMMSGPDLDHSAQLARETGMAVLASGGGWGRRRIYGVWRLPGWRGGGAGVVYRDGWFGGGDRGGGVRVGRCRGAAGLMAGVYSG